MFFLCVKWMFLNEWEVDCRNRNIRAPRVEILFWNYKRLSSIGLYFVFQRIAVGNVLNKQRYVK